MRKVSNSDVTVVIAALNEEEGIGPTLRELREALEDPFYLVMQEGRGKGLAVAQALRYVNAGTRYVVFIDADYTYPAEYVPRMIEVLEENPDVGMVTGSRFNDSAQRAPLTFGKC